MKCKVKHPLHARWRAMINRCYDKKHVSYKNYGARGVKVCDRWRVFENFVEDVSPHPKGMVLDRIDNNGKYEKDNCRWVTPTESNVNRRNTVYVEFKGKLIPRAEAARRAGIAIPSLNHRIEHGIPLDKPHKYLRCRRPIE